MADSPAGDRPDGAYRDGPAVDRAAGLRDPDVVSVERQQDAEDRIGAAGVRDTAADARDLMALRRDQASAARGRAMSARDARSEHAAAQPVTGGEIVRRAGMQRLRAARDRARGADYRSLADKDHQAAALDRQHAADDRLLAGADRAAFAHLRAIMASAAPAGAPSEAGIAEQDVAPCEATPAEPRRANRYFELSRDLMVTASLDGYFKSVNPALQHILGWSAEQFLARPLIDWIHPDDRASTLAQIQKLAEGEVAFSFVNRYEAIDGGYRWLDWTAVVASGEGLIYASARDVTDRERAKAALAASEKRTRQILESAHDAFVATDDRDVIIDWNAQAQVAFGWTREEALGRDLADTIFPESYRDEHRRDLQRLLAGNETERVGVRRELCALRRDGREFPIEFTMTARQTDTGLAFNAFLRDISERREAEEALKRGREQSERSRELSERSRALSERLLLAQGAVSRVFAEAQSSDQAMRGLVAALGGAMGWQLGAWWSPDDDGEVLHCRSVWHAHTAAAEFEAVTLGLTLVRGQALPGRVWASGKPAWTPDLASDPSFPRMEAATRTGLHASVCVPVVVDGAFRAAVEFFSAQTGTPDQPTRQTSARSLIRWAP